MFLFCRVWTVSRRLAESEAAESESQTAFDKLKQENAVARATKNADAKSKKNEVKSLEVSLGNYKEDKASTSDELDAVPWRSQAGKGRSGRDCDAAFVRDRSGACGEPWT